MAEYKITQISSQPPRAWEGPKGTIFYVKVRLEGHSKPVSIGKRSPDALKVGDSVYGTITEDFAHDEDKFKAEQNPAYSGGAGGSKPSYTPRDDMAIRAQWSIGQAMTAVYDNDSGNTGQVELLARELFNMVDRVKNPVPVQPEDDKDIAAAIEMFSKDDEEF